MARACISSQRAFLPGRAVGVRNPWKANLTCTCGVMVLRQYLLARFREETVAEFNRSPAFRVSDQMVVIFMVIGRLVWVLGRRRLLVVVAVSCLCLANR